ncbi:MAG TPA: NAD(P)H-quinone oxidoreductase [Candidatus Baltobacteraceae bacterium]|nr:NAD(P)H-quinone oxidoreductase [Candidatus Baltobacteraceae bacterium]
MRYVTYDEPGDPSVLRVAQMPAPVPRIGEVLIETEAAGVSRADTLQRRGNYPPPKSASPILGLEVSGTIAQLGADVDEYAVGDRVVALCNGGGYGEFVAVPVGQVLPLPAQWSFVEGATLPENAFTVYDNLLVRAHLAEGEIVLVHGGTSGIGTMAIMFARAVGARAIATAGSETKCRAALEIGAEAAIDYRSVDFVEEVLEYTAKRGVDVVLDIIGGDYVNRDLRTLATEGRIACIATAGGSESAIDLRYLLQRRATILGSSLRPRTDAEKAAIAAGLRAKIWPLLGARDPIVPVVDSVFTFSQAAEAHARLESSVHIGKIVLVPDI